MSAWYIIMPHRLLVNRSLRKASEDLRSRIDEYRIKYEREIERCTAEIEQAKVDKDNNFEKTKSSLIGEISKDSGFFDAVQAGLFKYVDLYLRRQSLNKVCKTKVLERQVLIEYGDFLSEQMKLIGEEIEIFEARKDKLVLQAKIDDVVELIGLSGCEIDVTADDDAQTLLLKVTELLRACEDDNWLTYHSLRRLRIVLQERVDLFPVIQYISWTIQQKKLLSRQLSNERRKVNEGKTEKTNELSQIYESLDALNRSLDEQARTVREYWAVPITQLNVQISFNNTMLKSLFESVKDDQEKLNGCFSELKDTNQQIQQMINLHSDDSWKWEGLQRQKADYRDDISSTKARIDMMQAKISQIKSELEAQKNALKQWFDRREMVFSLCKRNNVFLISDSNPKESDECRIINNRLAEFYRIEEEETKHATERFLVESAQIRQRKEEKTAELSAQITSAKKSQAEKHKVLSQASKQLSCSKSRDARFFLLKIFSDTEEVSKSKQALQLAEAQKKSADSRLSNLKAELAAAIIDYERQVESCRPIPYKHSAADQEEIQKLESRKAELMDKQGKNKSDRKEEYNEG